MATVTETETAAPPVPWETAEELLEALGGIALSRVRMRPLPGTATEADLIAVNERKSGICELIDGVLVEKTMGAYESYLAVLLSHLLMSFVRPRNLGVVLGADGMLKLFPGMIRIPDVSFLAWDRVPPGTITRRVAAPAVAPDLAVEVISLSNTKKEMAQKLLDYFAAGTRLVWYFDPGPRIVTVFRSPEQSTTLHEDQTLDGGDVLPGFALPLRGFFDEPDLEGGEPRGGANGAGQGG